MEEALLACLRARLGPLPSRAPSFTVYTDGGEVERCALATVEHRMALALRLLLPPPEEQHPGTRGQKLLAQATPEWIAGFAARQLFLQCEGVGATQPPGATAAATADDGAPPQLSAGAWARWVEWSASAGLGTAQSVGRAVHWAVERLPAALTLQQLRDITGLGHFTAPEVAPVLRLARAGRHTIGHRQLLSALEAVQAVARRRRPAADPAVEGLLPLVACWLCEKCAADAGASTGASAGASRLASIARVQRAVSAMCVDVVVDRQARPARAVAADAAAERVRAAAAELQGQLEAFYSAHAPQQLPRARTVAAAYVGRTVLLNRRLRAKYRADLKSVQAMRPAMRPKSTEAQAAQAPAPRAAPAGGAAAESVTSAQRQQATGVFAGQAARAVFGYVAESGAPCSSPPSPTADCDDAQWGSGSSSELSDADIADTPDMPAALCEEQWAQLELELDGLGSPHRTADGSTDSALDDDDSLGLGLGDLSAAQIDALLMLATDGDGDAPRDPALSPAPAAALGAGANVAAAMVVLQRQTSLESAFEGPALWDLNANANAGEHWPLPFSVRGFKVDGASTGALQLPDPTPAVGMTSKKRARQHGSGAGRPSKAARAC